MSIAHKKIDKDMNHWLVCVTDLYYAAELHLLTELCVSWNTCSIHCQQEKHMNLLCDLKSSIVNDTKQPLFVQAFFYQVYINHYVFFFLFWVSCQFKKAKN